MSFDCLLTPLTKQVQTALAFHHDAPVLLVRTVSLRVPPILAASGIFLWFFGLSWTPSPHPCQIWCLGDDSGFVLSFLFHPQLYDQQGLPSALF